MQYLGHTYAKYYLWFIWNSYLTGHLHFYLLNLTTCGQTLYYNVVGKTQGGASILEKSTIWGHCQPLDPTSEMWEQPQVSDTLQLVAQENWLLISVHKHPKLRFCAGPAKAEYNEILFSLWETGVTEARITRDSGMKMWARIHLQVPQSPLCKHQRYNKTEHIIKYKAGDKEENKRSRKVMSKNPGLKIPISGL